MMEGETRSFSVSLSNTPETDITIDITAAAGLAVSPTSLLFTSTNFSTVQNVSLTAQKDDTDTTDNPTSAVYKALLVDFADTRAWGSDWVLQPSISYRRANKNLGHTNE